ncbi:bifunctional methionine sulfoxide reductase B/A protein [Shewanella sp. Isolate11]|uniref:bifunctional methionine sulfoxide reductase B/A protein n=1 Tax=Shewanella sp. Isolate11 TaxID=2908530 RepID=UPI001EFE85F9|nr:bifunctional methionine sulfoxide reductase B/A protein [Shewanella sp. Isolate11]MCG9696984.1 bifunctional methionine sulfoxide reductase B/A protein [Shewanella sp. Isolate11]
MRKLTEFEQYVIEQKGTERPFSGDYYHWDAEGVYHCKRCDAPLYLSEHKFNAHCGWPAFDDEIKGAVKRIPDSDGQRIEIVCQHCDAHLGHVFEGEYLTDKNIRHCVNSVSMIFKPLEQSVAVSSEQQPQQSQQQFSYATLGGGCFWCLEAIFSQLNGVHSVQSGYSGGSEQDANYKAVCSASTGHAEVVQIEFDSEIISYETLLRVFFSSHDPTTLNRQGNDVGPQYRSVIFAHDTQQIDIASLMIQQLTEQQLYPTPIVTELVALEQFYPAETYHDDYFANNAQQPYCQVVVKPKLDKFKALFKEHLQTDRYE